MSVISAKNPIKYPRTFHLPDSPGAGSDDKIASIDDVKNLIGKKISVTEKMDGENTTFYRDGFHARSVNYHHNFTRDRIKAWHAAVADEIPDGWRVCGENLTYKHSIKYENLKHFFQVFSVWNDKNECLSWDDTKDFCNNTGMLYVSEDICFRGVKVVENKVYNREITFNDLMHNTFKHLHVGYSRSGKVEREGFVVRNAESFHYDDFNKNVFKWVRANHVQTNEHWLKNTEKNGCII